MKTSTIAIGCKEPDLFQELAEDLGLSDVKRRKFFEFGEYANLEIEVDENLNIVGGRFLPYK